MITPEKIIYSSRKTLCLQITKEGKLVVRSPKRASQKYIQGFIDRKMDWIEKSIQKILSRRPQVETVKISPEDQKKYKTQAREIFKQRLDHWSQIMNVKYAKFRLSSAKTRWGSCSGKNTISLNWNLILTSQELLDYVVVHELAHVKHKNHSSSFWDFVGQFFSEYKLARKQLRQFGHLLN